MELEKKLVVDAYGKWKERLKNVWPLTCLPDQKDAKASEAVRKQGNNLYLQTKHDEKLHGEVLSLYSKSVALAPSNSQELGLAYGNRSAFLLHIGKYEDCIIDIDRALKIIDSSGMKIKFLCRKVECMKNLGLSEYTKSLNEAKMLLEGISDSDESKEPLVEIRKKVKKIKANYNKPEGPEYYKNDTIDLPLTDNVFEKISIEHNKKYGRLLTASRDYNPGDVIFVEKLFARVVSPTEGYTNCHHCLKVCWSGVSCAYCNWAMFCSDDCRKKAWKSYHDIECPVITFLYVMKTVTWCPTTLAVKVMSMALKQAGTIAKLKAELKNVDQCKDVRTKGFYKNGQFKSDSIRSIYALESKKLDASEKDYLLQIALTIMVAMLRYTPLKSNFNLKKFEVLMHEDSVFLGSLYMKVVSVIMNNCFQMLPYLPIEDLAKKIPDDPRGACLSPLASLINHDCNPNASFCLTENGKFILFAIRPIKKSTQIFITYSKEFFNYPIEPRMAMMKYNFTCNCKACLENWPPELALIRGAQETMFRHDPEKKYVLGGSHMFNWSDDGDHEETIQNFSKKITMALRGSDRPTIVTCLLLEGLYMTIHSYYGGIKPRFYGKCKSR